MKIVYAIVALLLAGAAYLAFDWYRARDAEMSMKPPEAAAGLVLEARESVILANVAVGYPVLRQALDNFGNTLKGSLQGSENIKCIKSDFPRIKECLTVNWRVNYALDGPINVEPEGQKVRITVPAKFNGQAGFGGEIARAASLDKKNFDGSFVLSASASFGIDKRFCPILVPGEVTFGWKNEGRVQIIGRTSFRIMGLGFDVGPWNLDVGRHFNGQIKSALKQALNEASIPCDPAHNQITAIWRRYSFPFSIGGMPPLYANLEPTTLASSGILVEKDGLRLLARLGVKTTISTQKGSEESLGKVPENVSMAPNDGRVALAAPLVVPYSLIRTQLLRLKGERPLALKTDLGDTKIDINDVHIYPSGERLAVGVKFKADLPTRVFDAEGTLWLTALPKVDPDGKKVWLEDFEVTRQIDNDLWNALTVAFKDIIRHQVRKIAEYDLSTISKDAVSAITAAVAEPSKTGGVRFTLTKPDLRLGRIGVEKDALVVEAIFEAGVTADIEQFDIAGP